MTPRHGWFALALFGSLLLGLTSYADAATTQVTISIDDHNLCTQIAGSSAPVVDVTSGNTITYKAKVNNAGPFVPFELQFAGTGPFLDIYTQSNGTTPIARGPNGAIHSYQVVIVNGNKCANAREMGIIMR